MSFEPPRSENAPFGQGNRLKISGVFFKLKATMNLIEGDLEK
jgi:hypothetical protein